MTIFNRAERLMIFVGDLAVFALSLWISLFIRNGILPTLDEYKIHIVPFAIIFIAWALIFYIAGLYDKYTTILRDKIPVLILNSQLANSMIAVVFFYLIPYFGIAPKTLLFIDLFISFFLIYLWRIYGPLIFNIKDKEPAIIVGSGEEMKDLEKEINENPKFELELVSSVDLEKGNGIDFKDEIVRKVYSDNIKVIIIDLKDGKVEPILPHLYNLIFAGVKFFDMDKVYEDVFNRIPLSLLNHSWFLENVSATSKFSYDIFKRLMDIVVSFPLFIISLVFYPFVILAIKIEDGGEIFSRQVRVGQNNNPVNLLKFRTMLFNDAGEWKEKGKQNKVTKVGAFLRKSRLDEIPQLWNVLKGEVSLIGPRPEFAGPVEEYSKLIEFYNVRHIIKPGLSGWAQIYGEHAHHGIGVDETRNKLSYDLYYVKNRSLALDLQIALKTIKTILSRAGK